MVDYVLIAVDALQLFLWWLFLLVGYQGLIVFLSDVVAAAAVVAAIGGDDDPALVAVSC